LKKLIFCFIFGLLTIPIAAYVFVLLGYAPVATSASPLPLEKWFARTALHARIRSEAPTDSPVAASDETLISGTRLYRQQCAICHGLPDQQATAVAKGMFPRPPQFFLRHGVTDDPVGETYWKVANGIRLTGMPGYRESLSEQQMWQLSQMLAHANKLPVEALQILHQPIRGE
jgi:thiosulfate dehydrogenase